MNNRDNGGGLVRKEMVRNETCNKGTGQFYYRSLGDMRPDL